MRETFIVTVILVLSVCNILQAFVASNKNDALKTCIAALPDEKRPMVLDLIKPVTP